MKLLLDANLSPEVARLLKEGGHDAIHVRDIGLLGAPDPEILQAAAREDRILLTADVSRTTHRAFHLLDEEDRAMTRGRNQANMWLEGL